MLSSKFYSHSTNYMLETFKDFKSPYISFFHIREPDEIEEFKNLLISKHTKLFTLLILRDNIESFNNDADKNVYKCQYDYIIKNNGTKYDLECKVINLFSKILKGTFNG